jgi:hypothetical protein
MSISPKSPEELTLPSQKANKSLLGVLIIAGIRKLLYPSVPEIKTGTFICCANPMFRKRNKIKNWVIIFFI